MPTIKLTTDKVVTLLTAAIAWALLRWFDFELDERGELLVAGLVGWALGGFIAYFKDETRPAPSAIRAWNRWLQAHGHATP